MFKKVYKRIISAVLCTSLILGIMVFPTNEKVQAFASSSSFAKGGDVGWLSQMEASNYTFKDKDGKVRDCLSILKDYGIDSIRLRAWVNPSLTDKVNGHCSTAETVAMAVKAKNMGFRIMIDLHYSDTWADPSKQVKPAAWATDTFSGLKEDVYNYTLGVMNALKTAGITPEWVQVGNETNPGMLLPEGSISDFSKLTELINQGSRAVKTVDANSKVIIHLANGYDNVNFRKYFDALTANKAEYDVIGMSYYPYWSNVDYTANIDALGINLNDMAARYGKEVMVVEVGGLDTEPINTYNMLLAVQSKVKSVPNNMGTGVFYWEPEGAQSWSGYALSAWGADGKPTKAMEAFLPGAVEYNPYPVTAVALDRTNAIIEVGDTLALTPTITPSNATITGVKYTTSSSTVAKVDVSTGVVTGLIPGISTIAVTTLDGGKVANCIVTVTANKKLVTNYGFELGLNNWMVTGDTASVSIDTDKHSGRVALHYYSGDAKNFAVSQNITGLKNGSYKLSAWVSGGGGEITSKIYATTSTNTFETAFKNSGWDVWTKPIVNNIQVTNGTLTIGANLNLAPGNWGNVDEFELIKNEDTSLTDLKVDGVTIKDFNPDVTSYNVELAAGTTKVPVVTATTISGTAVIKATTILPGETTVVVSNGDITKTYTIKFSVLVYNPIKNPGFEPDATSWTISDPSAINASNDKHSGSKALGYYKDSAFTLTASQRLTGLSNGTYSLSAWAQGQAGNGKVDQIFATNSKAVKLTSDFTNTGWAVWSKTTINNIIVTDGTLTIGSYLDANAGDWGSYDDFELIQTSTETAATVAAGITSVVAPLKDATNLSLPIVPAGFTIAIKSATPAGIIGVNGAINLPITDTTVGLVFTITKTVDDTKADTESLNVVVPAKTIVIPNTETAATLAKLPKTGSPMDMEVLLLIGGIIILAGLFLTFKQKPIKK